MSVLVKDLVIGYWAKDPVNRGINLSVADGEMVLLKGPNGSGKTTFLKTLAGLIPPLAGSFYAPGAVLVPTRIPKIKGFTVTEFIDTCLSFTSKAGNKKYSVSAVLEKLGLGELAERDISTLSDGQFQKVCICPAVASGKKLLLLDEPTAFLDADSKVQLMEFLKSLKATILLSSHDLAVCEPYCDQTITFQNIR
ncbi:MAG: ABC transporter ATP-binding protein [Bacteroidales bacterium]|nr:ABC transporter ATP-binding protein [Bacteroidales bacterium]